MKNIILAFLLLISLFCFANDGAYYMSGNQLIPINETSIQVKKEILSLKRVHNDYLEVTVDYTFFNPEKNAKTILVGFEAFSPSGDSSFSPKNGQHPYMHDFTVNLNSKVLPYEISYVSNENKDKKFLLSDIEGERDFGDADFYYVYHFNATFLSGNNNLVHTYMFHLSGSIDYLYDFEYILTAVNRWANKQIDDFTLNIDMGDYQDFYINPTFFKSESEWTIKGIGKKIDAYTPEYRHSNGEKATAFFIQEGKIQFKKKNFRPNGELFLFTQNYLTRGEPFDMSFDLPLSTENRIYFSEVLDENSLKVLQNLPYARRGYVFNNKTLKNYFEKTPWYIPNPKYVPEPEYFTDTEIRWLHNLKDIKIIQK